MNVTTKHVDVTDGVSEWAVGLAVTVWVLSTLRMIEL